MFTTKLRIAAIGVFAFGILALGGMRNLRSLTAASVPEARKAPKELLEKRLEAAKRVYIEKSRRYQAGIGSPSELLGWSERWLDAELALREKKADQLAALKAHLDRTREVERMAIAYFKTGHARQSDADAATYRRINAEVRIYQATGKIPPPAVSDKPVPIPESLKPIEKKEKRERERAREKQRQIRQEKKPIPQRGIERR